MDIQKFFDFVDFEENKIINERRFFRIEKIKIPIQLQSIEGLKKTPKISEIIGIYFLCEGDEIIYIGQSVSLFNRILFHRRSKNFNQSYYIELPKEKLDKIEMDLIRKYKPKLNKMWNPNVVIKYIRNKEIKKQDINTNISIDTLIVPEQKIFNKQESIPQIDFQTKQIKKEEFEIRWIDPETIFLPQ